MAICTRARLIPEQFTGLDPMPVTMGILNEDLVRVEGLAISPDGKRLVAAEPDASRIVVFDIPDGLEPVTSWTLVDFSPSGVEPKGVVFDEKGRLFVALGDREEVRVFDLVKGEELVVYDAGGFAESLSYRAGSLFVSGGAYPPAEFASEVRAFLIGWSVIRALLCCESSNDLELAVRRDRPKGFSQAFSLVITSL